MNKVHRHPSWDVLRVHPIEASLNNNSRGLGIELFRGLASGYAKFLDSSRDTSPCGQSDSCGFARLLILDNQERTDP